MSRFTQTIKNFADASKLKTEIVNDRFVYLTSLSSRVSLGIGMLGTQTVEFKINLSSDFNSLSEIPAPTSMYFLSRNIPVHIGHWAIEYGQQSQKYWHVLRFVTTLSSLNQKRFDKIIHSLEDEFKLYARVASGR